jgi:6-phosphogluconolactonase
MITDATRSFLYVANSGSNSVSSFRINPASGEPTPLNPSTVSTGATPVALVLHPNGEFLYVACSGSGSGEGSVSGFSVNITSGSLSGGIQISTSAQPEGLVAK